MYSTVLCLLYITRPRNSTWNYSKTKVKLRDLNLEIQIEKKNLNFSLSLNFIADSKVQKNILILPTFPVFACFWFI